MTLPDDPRIRYAECDPSLCPCQRGLECDCAAGDEGEHFDEEDDVQHQIQRACIVCPIAAKRERTQMNNQDYMIETAKRALGIDLSPPKAPIPTMSDGDVCAYIVMTRAPEEIGSWLARLVYGTVEDSWHAADEVRAEINDVRVMSAKLRELTGGKL